LLRLGSLNVVTPLFGMLSTERDYHVAVPLVSIRR
jgi:hypothetical protein